MLKVKKKLLNVNDEDEGYDNDEDEEEKQIISRSAASLIPLRTELMDGGGSFIFSWNKKHRPIHEEAMLHYFVP